MQDLDLRLTENSLQNFVNMEKMVDLEDSDRDDCYQVSFSQNKNSQAQSVTSKYKNILRDHSQL